MVKLGIAFLVSTAAFAGEITTTAVSSETNKSPQYNCVKATMLAAKQCVNAGQLIPDPTRYAHCYSTSYDVTDIHEEADHSFCAVSIKCYASGDRCSN